MMAGVVSLLLSLLLGGFIFYQWVLAFEATAASLMLLAFYFRDFRRNTRQSQWPPLLPLALIFASGGAKSFYVATARETAMVGHRYIVGGGVLVRCLIVANTAQATTP